jgi:hypothetical protein
MMSKLAQVGCRVAPLYEDSPNGTVVEVLNNFYVRVKWDASGPSAASPDTGHTQIEQVQFLRKGLALPSSANATPCA